MQVIPRNLIHLVPSHEGLWPEFRRNLADLAAANPDWTQIILSDDEATDFVRRHYGQRELDALARIDPAYGPARSDLLRYLVLHQLGGVYFDNKSGASRPLDQILRPEDDYLVVQWDNGPTGVDAGCGFHPELSAVAGGEYINWVMISRAGHPFLAAVINRVLDNIETYSRHRFGVGKDGTLRTTGPIAFTRDHLDAGSVANPFRESEKMQDGSEAISDWPILNALLACANGADLVAVHSRGGYSNQSAGQTTVADGNPLSAERLRAVLDGDTGIGIMRHAEAGYERALTNKAHYGLGFA